MNKNEPLTIFKIYNQKTDTYTYKLLVPAEISVSAEFDHENDNEEDRKAIFEELKKVAHNELTNDEFKIFQFCDIYN